MTTPIWTAPIDWAPNHLMTAADLNTYVTDNLRVLKNPPMAISSPPSNSLNTNSTSFVALTGSSLTLEVLGDPDGDVLYGFWFNNFTHTVTGGVILLQPVVDGVAKSNLTISSYGNGFSGVYLHQNVAKGSHTFRLNWMVQSGTATLSGNWQFFAREIS